MKILIAIPAYNEGPVIGSVLSSIPKNIIIEGSRHKLDVLVINDCSTDNTASESICSGRELTLINHVINMGAGGATLTALQYAKLNNYDLMATMDADGQHNINDVISTINCCNDNSFDLVVGNRLSNSSQMSRMKFFGNIGISIFSRLIMGSTVKDSQSGLRAYSKRAIEKLRFHSLGYIFCSEMLMRAKDMKLSIGENNIEAIYTDYSISKGQSSWNGVEFIRKMLVLRIMEIF